MHVVPERHRVALTGIGLITPLGIGTERTWRALCSGDVAVAPLTRFDSSAYPSRVAAQIDDFDPTAHLSRRRAQWMDRFSQLAVASARLAAEDAGTSFETLRDDAGVFVGSALGGTTYAEEQMQSFAEHGLSGVRPLVTISVFGGAAASNVAIEFGLTGPSTANSNSCASGAMAIGDAFRAIARGDIRAAFAGGVEAPLAPLTFAAFTVARAMSRRNGDARTASRPFDTGRDGFVMAEGAGFVTLERYKDAVARGATPYCEILGYGSSNDAHHMSAPLPDGAQTAGAMLRALRDAALDPGAIEAINAHGSSTKLGDAAEALAYAKTFGPRASSIPVSATKGQHGHALGATGAWEIGFAALGMRAGLFPGAVNLENLAADCEVDCRREARELSPRYLISNSSGFGGINAALVLGAL